MFKSLSFYFSIFFFIVYCLAFTFANQPLIGLDPVFKIDPFLTDVPPVVYHYNSNSDFVYHYSLLKDILTGVSLSGWHYAANIIFTGQLFGLIPALFSDGPDAFFLLVSFVQPLFFIFSLSYLFANKGNLWISFTDNCVNLIISLIIIIFFYKISSYAVYLISDIKVAAFFYIEQHFHFTVGRGVLSVIVFYYYFFYKKNIKQIDYIIFTILIFILTFSDAWFAVHILSFIGFYFLFNISKKNLYITIYSLLIAIFAMLAAYFVSSDLQTYASDLFEKSQNYSRENKTDIKVIIHSFITIVSTSLIYIYLYLRKINTQFINILFASCFLIYFFSIFTGFYINDYSSRYTVLFFICSSVMFYTFFETNKKKLLIPLLFLSNILILIFSFQSFTKDENIITRYQEEIYCLKKINVNKDYLFVSSFWPGKIIFEKSGRNSNFLQVQAGWARNTKDGKFVKDQDWLPVFREYKWIVNENWKNLYDKETNGFLVLRENLPPKHAEELLKLPESKEYCNKKFIITKNIYILKNRNN